ncbi:MAG: stearoyl-CoA desaturase (delta-9 desaturase) [Candidatus Omnitrophota bacterium]|jgi:stearoyl-CoA desaturase (delta-9 desaturase)
MNKINKFLKTLDWKNVWFFGGTTLLATIGLPIYAYHFGLTKADWILFGFLAISTMMATTFGHHRLFAHKAFKANKVLQYLNVFFGAAAWEGSVMRWSSEHRDHHKYVDTDRDPYNIKRGFWFAHMGWFFTKRTPANFDNVKDLSKDKVILHQHQNYTLWAVTTGIAIPMFIGLCYGHMWGAFFLAVCGRLFIIHQCVFLINSYAHTFGTPTYDLTGSAVDSWVCAFLTNGEGYHSYHHRFPSDYRNGVKWYHWDPTKWLIFFYSRFGLTTDLNRTPEPKILLTRGDVEQTKLLDMVNNLKWDQTKIDQAILNVEEFYSGVIQKLKEWEVKSIDYKQACKQIAQMSQAALKEKSAQVKIAREEFLNKRKEWLAFMAQFNPAQIQTT